MIAFWSTLVNDEKALRAHLARPRELGTFEPRCRFLSVIFVSFYPSSTNDLLRFIHAFHSRARLNISREMFDYVLSYLRVMPEFLELLFTFGYQEYAQNLNHSSFRQRTSLHCTRVMLQIPELGWSGFGIQLCYSLKIVERSVSQKHWPWSIRHCAVYHAFDVKHIRTSWIIIKGDRETERLIQSASSADGSPMLSAYDTIVDAFASAMETHLVLCDSAVAGWPWYISYLEGKLQELTRGTKSIAADVLLSPAIDTPLSPTSKVASITTVSRSSTPNIGQGQGLSHGQYASIGPSAAAVTMNGSPLPQRQSKPPLTIYTNPQTGRRQPLPPGMTVESLDTPKTQNTPNEIYGQKRFSFADLQETQHVEEKANETLLAMNLNLQIISQIGKYYQSVMENEDLPHNIRTEAVGHVKHILHRMDTNECNLRLQISRVEALLRLLADRKSLVSTHSLE